MLLGKFEDQVSSGNGRFVGIRIERRERRAAVQGSGEGGGSGPCALYQREFAVGAGGRQYRKLVFLAPHHGGGIGLERCSGGSSGNFKVGLDYVVAIENRFFLNSFGNKLLLRAGEDQEKGRCRTLRHRQLRTYRPHRLQ